ncbi:uncharacterized protein LOC123465837 [Bubalus bubalis]|uniref:uncharacterized protein LOC123465837 n=1 Tax=Bubalus bubalis TaxID=89462 RepID=UPI000DBC7B84|nr:uncharacterized protein LOC123465837 [Bubalus bubalis]
MAPVPTRKHLLYLLPLLPTFTPTENASVYLGSILGRRTGRAGFRPPPPRGLAPRLPQNLEITPDRRGHRGKQPGSEQAQGTGRERCNHPSHVGVGCALGQKTGVPRRGALPGHRARSAVEPVPHRHRVPAPPPLPPAGTGASSATARTARRPSSPPGARSRSRRPDSMAIATLPGASRRSAAGPKPRRAEGGLSPEAQMRTRRGAGQPLRATKTP